MSDCQNAASRLSADSLNAFRRMLYYKCAMWDAAGDFENSAACEVDTAQLDSLAVGVDTASVLAMSTEDVRDFISDWMEREDNARFYDEGGE